MIRHACAAIALLAAIPVAAQSEQERLQARYDRALAAGYKALMLCGAIANAERAGASRSAESVANWELAGIQAPLDKIVGELPYEIDRETTTSSAPVAQLTRVAVAWSDDMPPRLALHDSQQGCFLQPIGGGSPAITTLRQTARLEPIDPQPFSMPALARVAEQAFGPNYGAQTRSTAVLVMRNGEVLGERYAPDFGPAVPQRTWSVAKSIAATLVGAAVLRGETTTDGKLPNGFPRPAVAAWRGVANGDLRSRISIDHLLRMASGRYSDTPGNRTDALYFGGATVDESAAPWPLIAKPGTMFRYANNDTLMAIESIAPGFKSHPPSALFDKLGMDRTVAETDWRGDYILSSQVWSTARDLATLGQLYLQRGTWNGEQVIPADWLAYVSRPSGPQPTGEFGYGAGFWLLNKSPGVPADTIAMQGNRGQYVVIVPSRDIVIVRRGEDPAGARFDVAAFTREVLAATGS